MAAGVAMVAAGAEPSKSLPAQQDAATIAHLNSALDWYHQMQATDDWIVQPSDEIYITTQRNLDNNVVSNAFTYARSLANVIGAEDSSTKKNADTRLSRLATLEATNNERLVGLQDQKTDLDARMAAHPPDEAVLAAQRNLILAQIDLDNAVEKSLENASSLFSGPSDTGNPDSFASQVAALQRASPAAIFDASGKTTPAKPTIKAPAAAAEGLFNRAATLFSLVRYQRGIEARSEAAAKLRVAADEMARPLSAELRGIMLTGTEASQGLAQSTDPARINQARDKLGAMTRRFRDLAAALIPLRQEERALDETRTNLADWKQSIISQRDVIMRGFLSRAVGLAIAIGLLAAISELWRRATFRYVHDARRRRQFLLIRRFATAILMTLVIIMGFVSDFSSFATFAGFITAGIAVALQTIILSVAAYFFLIGRYGVRVGDRVTVSGVTGDVIDIGLVRVFLMELAGTGIDLHPTGRVIVLANSALFSTTPVYKQLPGTNYAWHELFVTLVPDATPDALRDVLLKAVNEVYAEYRPSIERQHGALERLLDYQTELPVPSAHVRTADGGLEVVVRYPAEIRRMSEVDEEVTKKALAAVSSDAALRKAISALPRIRSAVKS